MTNNPEHRPTFTKAVWTDADFDQMRWHDCAVHALAFT
jgi:hypothetical protein